jgi:acyl-CoA synthetase (AMP-forming)/AMP-acid ligase II
MMLDGPPRGLLTHGAATRPEAAPPDGAASPRDPAPRWDTAPGQDRTPRRGPSRPDDADRVGTSTSTGFDDAGLDDPGPDDVELAGTLHDALDVVAARHPEAPFVFPSTRESISLSCLTQTARTMAGALVAVGVEPGERIGILAHNTPDFLLALVAINQAGAAACPLPLPTSASDLAGYATRLRATIAAAGIRRVLTGARISGLAQRFAGALGDVAFTAVADLAAAPGTPGGLPGAGPGDLALVQFTSGSTAAPKGVALTHRNILRGIAAIVDGIQLGQGDHGGIWLPLFHDMGLFATLSAALTGIPMTIWSPASFVKDPAGWLRAFLTRGGTISPAPSFGYEYLVAAIPPDEVAGLDMSRWRVALNGAEPIPPAAIRRFTEHFAPAGFAPAAMFPVYGMAEATLAVTFPPLGRAPVSVWVDRDPLATKGLALEVDPRHPRARGLVGVGRPVRDMRVRTAAADGTVIAEATGTADRPPTATATVHGTVHGTVGGTVGGTRTGVGGAGGRQVGEIQIRGGSVTGGYLTVDGPLGAGASGGPITADGWLRTGDLGFLLDGELFVTGRVKEMIIVRGVNYYPEDAESVVRDTPGLHRRRCVAYADTDDEGAETITILGETRLEDPAELARLRAELRTAVTAALGLREVTVALVAPDTLPRTSSGKFQRLAARELARRAAL